MPQVTSPFVVLAQGDGRSLDRAVLDKWCTDHGYVGVEVDGSSWATPQYSDFNNPNSWRCYPTQGPAPTVAPQQPPPQQPNPPPQQSGGGNSAWWQVRFGDGLSGWMMEGYLEPEGPDYYMEPWQGSSSSQGGGNGSSGLKPDFTENRVSATSAQLRPWVRDEIHRHLTWDEYNRLMETLSDVYDVASCGIDIASGFLNGNRIGAIVYPNFPVNTAEDCSPAWSSIKSTLDAANGVVVR